MCCSAALRSATAPLRATAAPAQGERVWTAMRYDLRGSTEVRSRLRLRSTIAGANNRLDIQSIVSWDREDRQELPLIGEAC